MKYLAWVLIVLLCISACSMKKMMFIESPSKYEFEKTVYQLKLSLENNGWVVSAPHDMQEHYKEQGFKTGKLTTMEICKPQYAVDIIDKDKNLRMLPMMPMRVGVYEKSDGKTYVSRMKLKMMKNMTGGAIKQSMKIGARDLEKALQEIIE